MDLLSKVLIIHKVTGFSRNLDNEITKKNKWYFYDNGIRNALILHLSNFFWRTHTKQEIDWVEEGDGKIIGYEFKWSAKKQPKAPAQWTKAYPAAEFHVIHPKNYLDFID